MSDQQLLHAILDTALAHARARAPGLAATLEAEQVGALQLTIGQAREVWELLRQLEDLLAHAARRTFPSRA